MKKLFRRNQVIVTVLAIMIAVAGYLNYADNNISGDKLKDDLVKEVAGEQGDNIDKDSDKILGKDTLLNSGKDIDSVDQEETTKQSNKGEKETTRDQAQEETTAKAANSDSAKAEGETNNPGEAVLVSGVGSNTFAATAKLNREQVRAKTKDTLQAIIDNKNLTEAAKTDAIKKMVELTDLAAKESAAETLLAAKGFENSVVTITDGKVDVAVVMETISDSQRAQIEDVVKRKTDIPVANIYITPVAQ